jgi:hypothetical protein
MSFLSTGSGERFQDPIPVDITKIGLRQSPASSDNVDFAFDSTSTDAATDSTPPTDSTSPTNSTPPTFNPVTRAKILDFRTMTTVLSYIQKNNLERRDQLAPLENEVDEIRELSVLGAFAIVSVRKHEIVAVVRSDFEEDGNLNLIASSHNISVDVDSNTHQRHSQPIASPSQSTPPLSAPPPSQSATPPEPPSAPRSSLIFHANPRRDEDEPISLTLRNAAIPECLKPYEDTKELPQKLKEYIETRP